MKKVTVALLLGLTGIGFQPSAQATASIFSFDSVFSGDPMTGTGATTPWITAGFADLSGGGVLMSINASGLGAGARAESVFFNVAGVSAGSLTFTWMSGPQAQSISLGSNSFKADGDGYFDIQFSYDTRVNVNGSNVLSNSTGPSIYKVTGTGLTSGAFVSLSSPVNEAGKGGGGSGPFYTAAHVQLGASGGGGSNWIAGSVTAAPEPEIYAMMIFGLGMVGFAARRKKKLAAEKLAVA